jgi:hypothetical protein
MHPLHQDKVGSDGCQLLALSKVFMDKVRQHIIPCQVVFVVSPGEVFVITEEAVGELRQFTASEMREDVTLELNYVSKDLFAIENLEWTKQVGIPKIPQWYRQGTIVIRFQHMTIAKDTTCQVCIRRRRDG